MGPAEEDVNAWTSRVIIDLTAPTDRPTDPLNDMTPRALRRLARRGHRARRRNLSDFEALAAQADVSPRRLRMLTDAWDEGGRDGLRALGPAVQPTAGPAGDPMTAGQATVERWRTIHFPLDALDVEVWRNRMTVWWLRPGDDPTRPLQRHPLMQLRLTSRARWHLYRRAARGEWWPVTVNGRAHAQSLQDCLEHVRADVLGEFWGPATG